MFLKSHIPYIRKASGFFLSCVLILSGFVPALSDEATGANTGANAGAQTQASNAGALQQQRAQAQTAYRAMQFASALQQYRNICQSPSHDGNDLYWMGESYFHLGYFVPAAQSFEQDLALNPKADGLRVRIVQCYIAAKQPQMAKEKCSAAMASVADPIVRQQLSALARFCDGPPTFHINTILRQVPGARVAEK